MLEPHKTAVSTTSWPKFKVRTGCITCKIRRVKCDEGKPACKRCSDTGRKCDGYQLPQAPSKTRKQHPSLSVDARSLTSNISSGEQRWLQYFSQHAGPALSSLTDTEFWSRMLPQLSLDEPAVRYALMALSSSYANVEQTLRTSRDEDAIVWDCSVKYYNQSISSLQQKFGTGTGDVAIPLVCCLLFTSLELLYEDRLHVLNHLESGLKILDSMQVQEGDSAFLITIKHKLYEIFGRLEAQATLYGKPTVARVIVPQVATTATASKKPFVDICEAKIELDTLTSLNLNFVRAAVDGTFFDRCPGDSPLRFQRSLHEQLRNWKHRLDKLQRSWSALEVEKVRMATLLRIRHLANYIYLSNHLEATESSYNAYRADFAALIDMARSLAPYFDNTSSNHSVPFQLEYSLIPPLYLVAVKCRDPHLRREAIRLLAALPGREGLWDPQIHSRVARRVMEIEEIGVLSSQSDTSTTRSVDATESARSRRQQPRIWVRSADIHRIPDLGRRYARLVFEVHTEDQGWSFWEEELSF